jgi:hypothetical protein
MMGNVFEWNETLIRSYRRGRRGSSYDHGFYGLRSSYRADGNSYGAGRDLGFRVASIPEPGTLLLLGLGAFSLVRRGKGR